MKRTRKSKYDVSIGLVVFDYLYDVWRIVEKNTKGKRWLKKDKDFILELRHSLRVVIKFFSTMVKDHSFPEEYVRIVKMWRPRR